MNILKSWKAWAAVITSVSAVAGIASGGVEKVYNLVHTNDIEQVKTQIIASNQELSKKMELMQIRYDKIDIDRRIYDLERRQEGIWARQPMTDADQVRLRKIERTLRRLERMRDALDARERELK